MTAIKLHLEFEK